MRVRTRMNGTDQRELTKSSANRQQSAFPIFPPVLRQVNSATWVGSGEGRGVGSGVVGSGEGSGVGRGVGSTSAIVGRGVGSTVVGLGVGSSVSIVAQTSSPDP